MKTASIQELAKAIQDAESIVLSTHRQCDGDGLGSQLGLLHALTAIGKKARVLNVDSTPKKYHFLEPDKYVQSFEEVHSPLETTDLALILDTNDRRLISPLYEELENSCKKILFIDHHPVLKEGPAPTEGSYIDTSAASTGEIAFQLIKTLDIPLNNIIARAIYTSIAFDTQLFRYVRNSPKSHLIAAELLEHETNPAEVHRCLFADHSVDKIRFLAKALEKIEYFADGQIGVLKLTRQDLKEHNMDSEESRDLIDMLMNVDILVVGAMIREDENGVYKVSFRSKGQIPVREVAESFGGGGHLYAAGATINGDYDDLKGKIVTSLENLLSPNLNESLP